MIDFHSHILPGIDDGSDSLETSIQMLQMEAQQGISCVVATPHFYAQKDKLESFLERRAGAEQALRAEMLKHPGLPEMRIGAEVRFYRGISQSEFLKQLTIGDSKAVLIEMPQCAWDESICSELGAIWQWQGLIPIIAHVERYLTPWNMGAVMRRLSMLPVYVQASAEFFLGRRTAAKAMRMLKADQIHLLGSDCHDLSSRKPNMDAAIDRITQKLGADALCRIGDYETRLLNPARSCAGPTHFERNGVEL